jgi:hypothetical protein
VTVLIIALSELQGGVREKVAERPSSLALQAGRLSRSECIVSQLFHPFWLFDFPATAIEPRRLKDSRYN